MLLLFHALKSS